MVHMKSQIAPTSRNTPKNSSPVRRAISKIHTLNTRFTSPASNADVPAADLNKPLEHNGILDETVVEPISPSVDIPMDENTTAMAPEHDNPSDNEDEPRIITDVQNGTWANRTRNGTAFVEECEEEDEGLPGLYAVDDDEDDEDDNGYNEEEEDEEELDGGLPASDMIDEE